MAFALASGELSATPNLGLGTGATNQPIANSQSLIANAQSPISGTVDPVASRYQLGEQLYLENCSSCHFAIPPAVFPTETWRNLLQDQEHYGKQLPLIIGPSLLIMWDYLRTFSRPQAEKEAIPYRVSSSRNFKALHPKVKLSQPANIASCVTCHPGAAAYNFRRLASEWENAP